MNGFNLGIGLGIDGLDVDTWILVGWVWFGWLDIRSFRTSFFLLFTEFIDWTHTLDRLIDSPNLIHFHL